MDYYGKMLAQAEKCVEIAHGFKADASVEVNEAARSWAAIQSAIGVAAYAGRTGQVPKFIPSLDIPQL